MNWNPHVPITCENHPDCPYCDEDIEGAPCTCFDWPPHDFDAKGVCRTCGLEAEKEQE